MISRLKRLVLFLTVVALVFWLGLKAHNLYLNHHAYQLSFALQEIYLFHALSAGIIYLLIELVNIKLPSQSGLLYLVGIAIKLGVFMVVFSQQFESLSSMAMFEKYALLIPMFIFVIIETLALANLLNKTEA